MTLLELIDTPRAYTALAEWAACLIYILLAKRTLQGRKLVLSLTGMLLVFLLYQWIAGMLPLSLWIAAMGGAVLLMFGCIFLLCDLVPLDALFLCVRAFVLAELSTSFAWQLYVWWAMKTQQTSLVVSTVMIVICYGVIFVIYFFLERDHIPHEDGLQVGRKEMVGAATIALGAFAMSNLSFVAPNTPFSTATGSILYVRTLIDFGGLVMLFSQQDKREEFRMRSENQAFNIVLQRQYDQYRLAQDNIDLLRREFHDLKHYMIAIRSETDPRRREHYLGELEQAIMMQEALTDTGNKVLDVILSTKSSYCIQKKITFSCLADGTLVDFMDVKDICSIFGNAVDNAIECVEQYDDPEKRLIQLSMYQKNQLLMIQVENYCDTELSPSGALPGTTKKNSAYHGYGLKSIQRAAEKYNGSITLQAKDHWFTLQILMTAKASPDLP